jgi:hypothetical protein
MSKYGALIEQAKNQNTEKPESKKTRKPENLTQVNKSDDKGVNLSIKVPESKRRHWVSEAKKQGTSLTAVIMESLSKKFGEPE